MNQTILRFGYPDTLVRAYEHWVVLLRPAQVTLGALVLACTDDARALPEITPEAFEELRQATADLESTLHAAFDYQKINYLMLMMVDPDVHFHVIPRYAGPREFAGVTFTDPGWPGQPSLAHVHETDARVLSAVREHLARGAAAG